VDGDEDLKRLQAADLAQVCFVRDYLVFTFESDVTSWQLSCLVWPRVTVEGAARNYGDDGYRDALCSLIGRVIVEAHQAPSEGIFFDLGGASIHLRPTEEEISGPDVAILRPEDGSGTTIWSSNDDVW
jgi:hypothetical protein